MGKYIVKRLLWMIPVVLGVSLLIMVILELCPGDPATTMLGMEATPETIAQLNKELGLDQPLAVRYVKFLWNAITKFDFGISYATRTPIRDAIMMRIPYTITISMISILISVAIGIPAGVIAATHQNSFIDNATMFCALFFVSMPNFWFALMMIAIFSLKLGILPSMVLIQ